MKLAAHIPINAESVPAGTRKVMMAAVICIGCHQAATLDADGRCDHCRRDGRGRAARVSEGERGRRSDAA